MAQVLRSRAELLSRVQNLVSDEPITVVYRDRDVFIGRSGQLRQAIVTTTEDEWLFGASTSAALAFIRELDYLFDIFDEVADHVEDAI